MESIEQMIKNLCPIGIKFVKLEEVGKCRLARQEGTHRTLYKSMTATGDHI